MGSRHGQRSKGGIRVLRLGVKALYQQTMPDGPVIEERGDWIGILMPPAT
uniref:Uncharacterized protein n=1 Tax=Desulfovibrio sp. U5L TaxID=596152 RepID=I2Q1A8_9BACT